MPIFFLCSLHIPPGILKPINRIIRHGLWGKKEDGKGKQSLASWEMICKPKSAGGLGIMDFGKQNDALLIKQLHKFYNKVDAPWVQLVWNYYTDVVPHVAKLCGSFWWRDVMKLAGNYMEFCQVTPVAGDSILFWSDKWRGNSLSQEFPRLFSFALDQNISLREMVNLDNIEEHFYLPLSAQAFDEFNQVREIVLSQNLNPEGKDVWKTQWKDGVYTASKYYHYMFRDQHASPILARIWKSKCILRIKFFAWLLINDRLNTRDMLRRRQCNVTNVYDYVLCPTHAVEDWMHLFFYCNFSQRVWNYLQISWGNGATMESILF
jgi:hypothetical protein